MRQDEAVMSKNLGSLRPRYKPTHHDALLFSIWHIRLHDAIAPHLSHLILRAINENEKVGKDKWYRFPCACRDGRTLQLVLGHRKQCTCYWENRIGDAGKVRFQRGA